MRAFDKLRGRGLARYALAALLLLAPFISFAQGIPAVTVSTAPGGGQQYSLTLQILILMTAITLLPGIVLMMTAFTRIVIVLAILEQFGLKRDLHARAAGCVRTHLRHDHGK